MDTNSTQDQPATGGQPSSASTQPSMPSTPTPPLPKPQAPSANTMAILAYLGILLLVPYLMAKNDPFVKFHLKQGLVLLILEIIGTFVYVIPFLGWLVGFVLWIACVALTIIGI